MLDKTLVALRQKLNNISLSGLNERNTDRVFVSPLLELLGYDLANLEETIAGYHLKDVAGGNDIAYAFLDHGHLLMLLEIRPLYSDLSALKNMARAFAIGRASGAPVLTLTNGVEWRLFAPDSSNAEPQLLEDIDIRSDDAAVKLKCLEFKRLARGDLPSKGNEDPAAKLAAGPRSAGPIKNRGYKISEDTHARLNRLRTQIMTQREVRDQEITNSMIVEDVLRLFLDAGDSFNHREISNETILKMRIEEALLRRFST